MKRALLPVIALFFIWTTIFSQTPQTIPYQAVARNSSGNLLVNQNVSLRFTVHDLTATGGVLYQETQSATTNKLGLFNVNVGAGSVVSGSFSGANWSNGHAKFMQVEIDPAGGSSYTDMGAAQMMSVPYALYAGSAGSVPSGNLTESTSNVLSITGGSSSVLSASGTTIQVKKATSSQDGYLASADWTTFNNKQSALTFNAPLSNASNTISCATCATTTNGGALSGTAPVSVSASGAISCATCLTTSSLTGLANPSATIGMTATNGSATTAMRSDAAPAINAGITPAWTGTHTFSNSTYSAVFTGGPVGIGTASPNAELHVVTGDQSGGSLAGWGTAEMVIGKAGSTGGGLGLSYDGTNSVATIYALAPSVAWKDLAFRANNTVFYYGGGTEGMRLNTSGNVGIGTSTPAVKTEIAAGATELLKLSSNIGGTNNHSYIDFLTYASTSGVVGRIGAIDMGNYNGSLVFEVNNQTSANSSTTTEAMRVTNSGPFIAGTYMTPGNIETIYDGAGTNSGYHTLQDNTYFAMTGLNIYSNGHFVGDIRLAGSYLGTVLSTSSTWYGYSGSSTQGAACGNGTNQSNTKGNDQDNTWHWAYCPDNYIATGIEIYNSGSTLDGCLKLKCTALGGGYVTYNNNTASTATGNYSSDGPTNGNTTLANLEGIESAFSTPWGTGADNVYHTAWCPAGTFVRGIKIWATGSLDGDMSVYCTGINHN